MLLPSVASRTQSLRDARYRTAVAVASGLLLYATGLSFGTAGEASASKCTRTGSPHADILKGTSGDDVLCGKGGADRLIGGGGSDVIRGQGGRDILLGRRGADLLQGGTGADEVRGEAGNDRLRGNDTGDELYGSIGDDELDGGPGEDVLDGGTGLNVCVDDGVDTLRDCVDDTQPTLEGFDISPREIDTSEGDAEVSFSVSVADDLSGVHEVVVSIRNPKDDDRMQRSLTLTPDYGALLSGTTQRGVVGGALEIPRHSPPGTHVIRWISIQDRARNEITVTREELEARGLPTTYEHTSRVDSEPPRLRGLTFNPETIDTSASGAVVEFAVEASDDLAGVESVSVSSVWPTGIGYGNGIYEMSGSETSGRWSGELFIPRYAPKGTYRVGVSLWDRADNYIFYRTNELAALGLPTTFEQVADGDLTAPLLTSASVSPPRIDTANSDQFVTVELGVSDDLAGVERVSVELRSPSGHEYWGGDPVELVSGDSTHGTWRGRIRIPRYSERGTYEVSLVSMEDGARNWDNFHAAELRDAGFSTTFENERELSGPGG